MNREAFLQQAKDFEVKYGGTLDQVIKGISIINDSHPWTIMRAAELIKWVEAGEYDRILEGCRTKKCPVCMQEVAAECVTCPYCGHVF